jgi:hypothetical protein
MRLLIQCDDVHIVESVINQHLVVSCSDELE